MLWRPNGRGLHSTPFKRSNDQLEYHDFLPYSLSLVCEESPQVGASRPYNIDHKESTRVRLGEQHTQDSNMQHNHAHKWRLELKGQHKEFTTRMELKSLTQRSKCVGAESGCLSMLSECLVCFSMRLGVSFIALRQLGAVGDQLGRQFLHYVEWCTGQPLFMSGARSPSISGASDRCSSGLFGAPDTVRCTPDNPVHPADRWSWPCVARWSRGRPLAAGAVGSPDSPVYHQTVRWILATLPFSFPESDEFVVDDSPDSPVHHRTVRWFIVVQLRRFPRAVSSTSASLEHRTLSGAPQDSPVCQAELTLSHFFSPSFGTISST
jgi:hypothetical protein